MGQLLDLHLRRREDNGLRLRRLGEELADDAQFLALVADVGRLVNRLVGFRDGDVDFGRVAQDALGQLADFGRQRGREHHRLTLARQVGDNLQDVVAEAHVEHAVGLVENQALDVREVDAAVLQVGNHAARGGNHHVGAHQHAPLLNVPALAVAAAVDHRGRDGQVVGEALELLVDLLRQLARGDDDERLDHVVLVALDEQPVEQRQRIGRRLARTGLGAADDVAPLEDDRDGLLLHGGHLVKVHIVQTVEDFILQIQFVESHES